MTTGLTASTSTSAQITWSDLPAETNYFVEWSTFSDFHALAGSDYTAPNVTSYVATGLTTGVTYYFRVRAGNGSRCYGPYSATASVTPGGGPGPGSATLRLASGWNMISAPYVDATSTRGHFFPTALDAYRYDPPSGYAPLATTDPLALGAGYWVLMPHADSTVVSGPDTAAVAWTLVRGWNLVGAGFATVALADVPGLAALADVSGAYAYDPPSSTYVRATAIAPGQGLWLRADVAGTVTLPH